MPDLSHFNLPHSFEFILSKSKTTFKKLVKSKAKEYAFNTLMLKKEGHTKLANLSYHDLSIQDYLTASVFKLAQKQAIFRWRCRMELFGENFRGGMDSTLCLMCRATLSKQI